MCAPDSVFNGMRVGTQVVPGFPMKGRQPYSTLAGTEEITGALEKFQRLGGDAQWSKIATMTVFEWPSCPSQNASIPDPDKLICPWLVQIYARLPSLLTLSMATLLALLQNGLQSAGIWFATATGLAPTAILSPHSHLWVRFEQATEELTLIHRTQRAACNQQKRI